MLKADSESIMIDDGLMMVQDRCFTPVNWRVPSTMTYDAIFRGNFGSFASLRLIRACYPPWALLVLSIWFWRVFSE